MKLNLVKPRKALNKAFLKVKPNRSEIENFKTNLIQLLDTINESESEEFHKNLVSELLKDTYYKENHFINTKGRTDLVIHNGKNAKSTVGVIIETKKPTNKVEMLSKDKINTKAFQELVLYYLRERISLKNLEIKYIVATNIFEWFIFDANIFEKEFAQNKTLVKQFTDFEEGRLSGKTTDFFYKEIAEPAIENIKNEIEFTYFDIREYNKPLRNDDKKDDNKLIALYKLLSPEHLLKLPFINDSNSLDKSFYTELLHIIGLSETKEGSKKLIGRKPESERDQGSLLENTMTILKVEDCLSQVKASNYGENREEQLYNVALELVITWINRILFLKLLEGQLIKYHKGDNSYKFLNFEQIPDYDALNKLFFQVLAIKESERSELVKKRFGKIPYLNSSLFEPNELEHKTVRISNLEDEYSIPLLNSTVLKDKTSKRQKGEKNTLEYLFGFLDSYDFASEGAEDIQEDNKRLINASVLGLIFEKINGYKDGSFFTPGFITMYMARETIRRAVVQKFNEAKNWECKDFNELYDKIENKKEANEIINSLKICDPAVGSGHFLVSALNEIIAIKSELKVLLDGEGKTLRDYHVEVVNDELIVSDEDGLFFEYNPNNKESQRVQETLFHEKETIIENCLFGVDININSVKICRLRLWIELLKNAYYKYGTEELETLPNIDINIKCGNSLISRYALDADIKKALKKSKWTIDSYRLAVMTYRNAKSKEEKQAMSKLIDQIKNDFESEIAANDKRVTKLNKLKGELFALTTQTKIFEQTKKEKAEWNKKVNKLTSDIEKLETELEEIRNNKIYENAFEWRFEFPEVLNSEGDYLGFDVIIGNPPYGVSIKGLERTHLVSSVSKVPDYEIYYWFIDRGHQILKENGVISYIIPNSILFNVFAQDYRLSLFEKWSIKEMLDCTDIDIFEDATVRNIIFQFVKNDIDNMLSYRRANSVTSFEELSVRHIVTISKDVVISNNQNWGLIFKLDQTILSLVKKIKTNNILSEYYDSTQGYIPYRKSDLLKEYGEEKAKRIVKNREWHSDYKINDEYKEEIFGESISKFSYRKTESYIWYGKHLATYVDLKYFNQKRLLIREITNPGIIACLIEEEFVNDPQIISIIEKEDSLSLEFLWGILNSKLATFYHFNSSPKATKGAFPKILVYDINNFPLPEDLSSELCKKLKNLVKYLLNQRRLNHEFEIKTLEFEINQLVYELYGLTKEEIEIVENS